jgi:hypothetical protein
MNREEQRRRTVEAAEAKARAMVNAAIRRWVAGLSDAQWEKLKRDEDQRRKESKP